MDPEQLIEHFNLDGEIWLEFFREEQALDREAGGRDTRQRHEGVSSDVMRKQGGVTRDINART